MSLNLAAFDACRGKRLLRRLFESIHPEVLQLTSVSVRKSVNIANPSSASTEAAFRLAIHDAVADVGWR